MKPYQLTLARALRLDHIPPPRVAFVCTAGIFFILAILLTACNAEKISQAQLKLAQFAVKKNDLPEGWHYSGENWYQSLGGENYVRAYQVSDTPKIGFGHTISAYQIEMEAKEAYSNWENDVFSGKWDYFEEANFVPSNPNDLYRFECQQIFSDTSIIYCSYLQQHGRFISHVSVNLDPEFMSFEQLNEILEILDKRLNEISIDD